MLPSQKSFNRMVWLSEAGFGLVVVSIALSLLSVCFPKWYPTSLFDIEVFVYGGTFMLAVLTSYIVRRYRLFLGVLSEWRSYRPGKGFYIGVYCALVGSSTCLLRPFVSIPTMQLEDFNTIIFLLSFLSLIAAILYQQKAAEQRIQEEHTVTSEE